MQVFERGMGVVQSNVTNASTPGYVRQRQGLEAMPSDLDRGLPGGVSSSGTLSSRSAYAELSIRRQMSAYGAAQERATQLGSLEPVFDISANSGLGGATNRFFQSLSSLTVSPNDPSARQTALDSASTLARTFQQTAAGVTSAMTAADNDIASRVQQLNSLLGRLQALNKEFMSDFRMQNDSGLDAQLHTVLEQLSEIADYTMLREPNGSVNIFLGGQSAVLLGDDVFPVTSGVEGTGTGVFDAQGNSITGKIGGGRLAALLDVRNTTLPGYLNEINRLAESVADTVNTTLAAGLDMNGLPPTTNLFAYDSTIGAAVSITVNNLAPEDLALASAGAPGGNGNAIALAALDKAKVVGGLTFAQFYGGVAAGLGRELASAREMGTVQKSLVFQAKDLRDQMSRVNLDEEALTLMEFQRSYQASAQLIKTIDEMLETAMSILR